MKHILWIAVILLVVFVTAVTISADPAGWSTDTRLTDDPALSEGASVATDPWGNIHVVWHDYRHGPNAEIYYTKIDSSGTVLIDEKRLTINTSVNNRYPSISSDTSGNLHIAWENTRDWAPLPIHEIYYRKLDNNGNTLAGDVRVSFTCGGGCSSSVYASLSTDPNGNVHIAWQNNKFSYPQIFYRKLSNSGAYLSPEVDVSDGPDLSLGASLDTDPSGNVHIAWYDWRDGGYPEIYYKKLDNNGNNLTTSLRLTQDEWSYLGSQHPTLATDLSGNVHIAWHDFQEFSGYYFPQIFYEKLDNNGNTLVDDRRLTFVPPGGHNPSASVDSQGNVHIAWHDYRDGGQPELYYTKLDNNGNNLTTSLRLTSDPAISMYPFLDVDINDDIHIAWHDYRDGNYEIYYKRTVPNTPPTISGLPDLTMDEDSGFNDNLIYLPSYASDSETPPENLDYLIESQSDTSVVNCIIDIFLYIDCTTQSDQYGSSTIVVRVSDGEYSDTDDFIATVLPVNDPPVVGDIPDVTMDENTQDSSIDLDDYVYDLDNPDWEISWTYSGNTNIQVSIDGSHVVTFTPVPDWFGAEVITFTARDPGSLEDSDPSTVTVLQANDPPVLDPIGDKQVDENSTLTIQLTASDPDNDTLTFGTNAPFGYLNPDTGLFEWTPTFDDAGDYIVTFSVTDDYLLDEETITITVVDVNHGGPRMAFPQLHGGSCIPPSSNIISWWPGDGNPDDIIDGNNGTLMNGATFAPGKVGEAFSLDGINDFIRVPNSPSLQNANTTLTLETWIYTKTVSAQMIMVKRSSLHDKQWYFRVIPGGAELFLEFWIWDGSAFRGVTGTTPVPINRWNHVAAVYDKNAQTLTFYVNGIAEVNNFPYVMQSYPSDIDIGAHSAYNEQYLNGFIDEASIYNYILTPSEIRAIFRAGSAGKCKV